MEDEGLVLQETLTRFGLSSHHQRELEVQVCSPPYVYLTGTWSGWPRIARSHTEISLSLSELLHRDTNLACKRE